MRSTRTQASPGPGASKSEYGISSSFSIRPTSDARPTCADAKTREPSSGTLRHARAHERDRHAALVRLPQKVRPDLDLGEHDHAGPKRVEGRSNAGVHVDRHEGDRGAAGEIRVGGLPTHR